MLSLAITLDGPYAEPSRVGRAVSLADGVVFTVMFIAAGTGVPDHQAGRGLGHDLDRGRARCRGRVGVPGLDRQPGTRGFSAGEALQVARPPDGLSDAVLVVAGLIALTIVVALSLSPQARPTAKMPCPRELEALDGYISREGTRSAGSS